MQNKSGISTLFGRQIDLNAKSANGQESASFNVHQNRFAITETLPSENVRHSGNVFVCRRQPWINVNTRRKLLGQQMHTHRTIRIDRLQFKSVHAIWCSLTDYYPFRKAMHRQLVRQEILQKNPKTHRKIRFDGLETMRAKPMRTFHEMNR
jgi:hypothetical protein